MKRELKGPRFWKLDKLNAEAVQENIKTDFQWIAIKHHEEVTKLLDKQQDYEEKIAQELLSVGEPLPITRTHAKENILNILDDDKEPTESGQTIACIFLFYPVVGSYHAEHCPMSVPTSQTP